MVSWVKKVNGKNARHVALTRDLVRQGHVILQVTYLISGPMHARDIFTSVLSYAAANKNFCLDEKL